MSTQDQVRVIMQQLDTMEGGRDNRLPPLLALPQIQTLIDYMQSGGELPRSALEAICWWSNVGATDWENWTTEAILDFLKVETDQLEREYEEGNRARKLALEEGHTPEVAQKVSDEVRERARDQYMHDGEPMDLARQYEYARRRLHQDPDFMPLTEPISVLPSEDVVRVSKGKLTPYGSRLHEKEHKTRRLKVLPTIYMIYDAKRGHGMVSLNRIQTTHKDE